MAFAENLDRAAGSAVCGFLANGGNAALATVMVNGLLTPGGQVPALAGGLGLLALNYGCSYNPDSAPAATTEIGGCLRSDDGGLLLGAEYEDGLDYFASSIAYWTVDSVEWLDWSDVDGWNWHARFHGRNQDGTTYSWSTSAPKVHAHSGSKFKRWFAKPAPGATCAVPAPPWTGHNPPPVTVPDVDCDITVEFLAWKMDDGGIVSPILKMTSAQSTYASGGVISGCNFNPIIYVGPPGGGGGGTYYPWVDGPDGPDGEPWWVDLVKRLGVQAAVAAAMEILKRLFQEKAPGAVYRLVSACEKDADGDPISQSREVIIPELPLLNAAIARLDALPELTQGLKDFKQPVCRDRPQVSGQLVTVNFRSLDQSDASPGALRKLLRYRDLSGTDEAGHVAHWMGFEWQAGPHIVISKGAPWGIVQVWAASPEEGRRVIRHAADAAGVDLTVQGHEFVDSTPSSPRYGRAGTMRVCLWQDGTPMISKRPTSNGMPGWKRNP